jgi:hypothetical protein
LAADDFSDAAFWQIRTLEHQRGVSVSGRLLEVVQPSAFEALVLAIDSAAQRSLLSEEPVSVDHASVELVATARVDQAVPGGSLSGVGIPTDEWQRVARTLRSKASQVSGEVPAWIRLVNMERPAPFRTRCVGHPSIKRTEPHRKEPAWSSFTYNIDAVFIGMDVHKDSISVGILNPGHDTPDVEKIFNDPESMRRLIGRFDDPSRLRVCYEAGPTGYDLARDLRRMGVACEVIAPSLIPKAPGDRVKTDTRDCRRLARLHRAGELVAVRVPPPPQQVPPPPLEDLAGRLCLDLQARNVAGCSALR